MKIRDAHRDARSGFTMVEIAICLAIIGLALVAIIGVLPIGMNVQRDNREETVINQDSTVFLESIRNGMQSGSDLTNYVYSITNYVTQFNADMSVANTYINGYAYNTPAYVYNNVLQYFTLTNNAQIIGLLGTPEFFFKDGLTPTNNMVSGGYSNHVYAYVHALSGPAVEKPPQDNSILIGDSFTYRILAVNAPQATDTNLLNTNALPPAEVIYNNLMAENLHELRLTFAWPVRPNGAISPDAPLPQTQRSLIAGGIFQTNDNGQELYYYQSQSFTNAP